METPIEYPENLPPFSADDWSKNLGSADSTNSSLIKYASFALITKCSLQLKLTKESHNTLGN